MAELYIPEEVSKEYILTSLSPAEKMRLMSVSGGYFDAILEYFKKNAQQGQAALVSAVKEDRSFTALSILKALENAGKIRGAPTTEIAENAYPFANEIDYREAVLIVAAAYGAERTYFDLASHLQDFEISREASGLLVKCAAEFGSRDLIDDAAENFVWSYEYVLASVGKAPQATAQRVELVLELLEEAPQMRNPVLNNRRRRVNPYLTAMKYLLDNGLRANQYERVRKRVQEYVNDARLLALASQSNNVEIFFVLLSKNPKRYYQRRATGIAPDYQHYLEA